MEMNADRDDAPLRPRRTARPWRVWTVVGLICAAFWGWAILYARPVVIDLNQLAKAVRFADQPVASSEPVRERTHVPEAPLRPVIREPVQPRLEPARPGGVEQGADAPRQTVFNDSNYRPRTDINTMQPPPRRYYAANQSSRRSSDTVRNESVRWTWMGANRKPIPITVKWQTRNGWIEYGSVCSDMRQGSIEYRDCRKAAKELFLDRCRRGVGRAYCHAENNYFP